MSVRAFIPARGWRRDMHGEKVREGVVATETIVNNTVEGGVY